METETVKLIISSVASTVISTGLIAAILHHYYDKRIRTHEIKLQKYYMLIEELGKLASNIPELHKLWPLFNSALLFASDDVVMEILKFNKAFRAALEKSKKEKSVPIVPETEIRSLVIAIRKELYLKSSSIKKEGLWFFTLEKQNSP